VPPNPGARRRAATRPAGPSAQPQIGADFDGLKDLSVARDAVGGRLASEEESISQSFEVREEAQDFHGLRTLGRDDVDRRQLPVEAVEAR
jgi:hypothetical protein